MLSPFLPTENAVMSVDEQEIDTATRHANEFCDNNTTMTLRDLGEAEKEKIKRDGVVIDGWVHDQMWYGEEGEGDGA